jgi:renal tumor antigen
MHILKYCHPGHNDHVEHLLKRREKGSNTGIHFVDLKLKGGKLQLKNQPNQSQSIFHNIPTICKRKYRILAKKGEGTFSEVVKAQCIKTSKFVPTKCMKGSFKSIEQVTRMQEIQALQRLSTHPNIVKLQEVIFDPPSRKLCLVFELMEMNIYELIRKRHHYLTEDRVKSLMYQLMKGEVLQFEF